MAWKRGWPEQYVITKVIFNFMQGTKIEYSPKVSIIMNCFNGEAFLIEAVESILNQTYGNWELIFWNNKSTDNSAAIVQSFKDRRIRYFMAETHTPLGEARRLAVEKALGVWIGFLDVDDTWYPGKLQKQIDIIKKENKNLGLVYSRCEHQRLYSSFGRKKIKTKVLPSCKNLPEDNLEKELFLGNLIPFPSVMYRKDALDFIGGFPNFKHPPDYFVSLAISQRFSCRAVDAVLCSYRVHDNNLSQKIPEDGYSEPVEIVSMLAPEGRRANLVKYNLARHVFFLIKAGQFIRAFRAMSSMSVVDLVTGISGLMVYRFKYRGGF